METKEKLNIFTSTGIKLLHHPFVISKIQKKKGVPVTVQLAPTSKCNLNCVFCSNVNRKEHEELNLDTIINVLEKLKNLGTKAVEITGGGDPTCYPQINSLIHILSNVLGFQVGMITNGVAFKKNIHEENRNKLHWVRVSLNSLDYVKEIDIPKIKGTLGFSYVMNEKTTGNIKEKLLSYVKRYNAKYVRIVPNCQTSNEQQEKNNEMYSKEIAGWGEPFFYQPKVFKQPERCWWCYFKPFILHDGYVYPCSSVVLNDTSDRQFHEKYRWVKIEDLPFQYESTMYPFPTDSCTHCVFSGQNEQIESLVNPSGMENFL